MRDRGLLIAWTMLCLLLAASVYYAEATYSHGQGSGLAGGSGAAASGAVVDLSDGGLGDAAGVAIDAPGAGQPGGAASGGVEVKPPAADRADGRSVSILDPHAPPPRVAYAAPHPPEDGRPRIILIMSEIGLSRARSRDAIDRLPSEVTMAVMAYVDDREGWISDVRASGHEALMAVPMEPANYPRIDPGPEPLLTNMDDLENLARYDKALRNVSGVVGVLAHMGGRFLADSARVRPILAATMDRGFMFVDSRSSPDSAVEALAVGQELYVLLNDRFIDDEPSQQAIAERLTDLEMIAGRRGHAVGVARPLPVTIELIDAWAEDLGERGFVLAPASAAARRLTQ